MYILWKSSNYLWLQMFEWHFFSCIANIKFVESLFTLSVIPWEDLMQTVTPWGGNVGRVSVVPRHTLRQLGSTKGSDVEGHNLTFLWSLNNKKINLHDSTLFIFQSIKCKFASIFRPKKSVNNLLIITNVSVSET